MTRNSIYLVIVLSIIWIILSESISLFSIAMGVFVSVVCIWFSHKHIPYKALPFNFCKLLFHAFYLVGQIYLGGFNVIKIVITGEKVELVETASTIENTSLRTILAASITLTPGSSIIAIEDNKFTVICLRSRKCPPVDDPAAYIKGDLEDRIAKIEK